VTVPTTWCPTFRADTRVATRDAGSELTGDRPAAQSALARSQTPASFVNLTPAGSRLEQPPALPYGPEPVHTSQTFR
jgi:hypothetical protein